MHFSKELQHTAATHMPRQAGIAGQIRYPLANTDPIRSCRNPVDPATAAGRCQVAKQQANQRRLAGSVRPEQSKNVSPPNANRAVRQRIKMPVSLAQTLRFDQILDRHGRIVLGRMRLQQ